MKAEEIFQNTVGVMKALCTAEGVAEALKRARGRTEDENRDLLARERKNVNELVRRIAGGESRAAIDAAPRDTVDAFVLRYVGNRDLFMKTFPDGIENIDSDPVALWAAVMISPRDEKENG